jgi:hypothetical protein
MHIAKRLLLLALICAGVFTVVAGQAVKGSLLGTITDSNGAAAAGASVTITETRTNISATTTTNQDGNYVFANVKDGVYRVEASQKGFKKVVREGVIVDVNTTIRVDLDLQVGEVSETVTIEATSAPLLQTDRADTGRIIEGKQVAELPLGFNRNFQGLLITVPGATRPTRPHSQFFNSQDSLESKVNGQERMSNNFQIEGVDDNEKTGLLQVLIPAADAIESVSVSTSNFNAEFGRAGGAVSTVTLKSGTNDIHGSAFFFGNNNNSQAGEFFTHGTAPTFYRQAGGSIGGPIKKDKLFYFGDYQFTSDKLGTVNRLTVPYPEWFNGDFRTATTTIYDPTTGNADGSGRQQISCNGVLNVICPSRISPIATKLLGFIGRPNIPGATLGAPGYVYGTPNYVFNQVREKYTHAFDVKLNYRISEKNDLSYRFSFQRPEVFDPGAFGVYGGPNASGGFDGSGTQKTISTAGNYTRTFSPSLILDGRFGVSWYHNVATTVASGLKTSDEVGIKGINTDEFSSGLTHINIAGFSDPLLGFSASLPWDRGETTYIGSAIVTKISGNHTLKFGEEVHKNRDLLLQIQDAGGVRGEFQFTGGRTALLGNNAAIGGIANSFASFLLDLPGTVRRDIKVFDQPGTKHWSFFEFIHDKWQVNQKLTIDLGLRHEYYTPLVGLVDRGGLSNYNPSDNTERVAGYGDVSQNVGVKGTWKNLAPRFGIAYRLTDKTVVRAGYGVSIIPFPDNRYAFNFPVKQTNVFNAPNGFQPAGSLAAGFPAPVLFDIPANGIIDANLPILKNSALQYVPTDLREGRLHSWNVAFQRELWWGFTAEAAYVGNTGRDVLADFNLNAANVLGTAVVGNDNAARRLFPTYGRTADVTQRVGTNTNYHSLQAKFDRRFKNSFLLTTSYTFGRAITSSGTDNGGIDTPADPKIDHSRAGFDRTHSFVQSFVWAIPFAQKTHGALRWALDGWQVTGILVAQSGTPLDFTTSGANLHAPGNTQRPNVSGEPKVLGGFGPGQLYFDTSVFSTPAATLTGSFDPNLKYAPFGNLTRNSSINGPGYWNLDASIFKKFKFTERFGGELRVDSFNTLNHTNPGNPQTNVTNATFGQITGTASSPRALRFGARVTF